MKKALALLIAVLMVFLCCACNDDDSGNTKTKKSSNNNNSAASDTVEDETSDEVTPTVKVNGSGFSDPISVDSFVYPQVLPEYGTLPSTLDTAWDAGVSKKKGGADALAATRRKAICETKNTLDIYKIKGKVYYVSPNGNDSNDGLSPQTAVKTLNASLFSMHIAKPGDAILFERNGVWRLTNTFRCEEGITYGSYGEGEKPAFLGSPRNYANTEYWHPSNRENIWKITVVDDDVGLVVCNHGELVGTKRLNGVITLEKNGDFYFNQKQDTLYYYCDKGNPGKAYEDIEFGLHMSIVTVISTHDVTLDNIRM